MVVTTKKDRLGKYRLDAVIGEGAMGVVYRAFDEDIERPVAIKVLHSHLLNDDMGAELATRFRLEAKAAARCMHTHIVTVFDYGVSDNAHYIVMEFIEGVDLRTLLRQEKRIPFRQASDTIFQVLSALEHAHKNGVVHRDIKPANIMILDSGQVKVADFGVARPTPGHGRFTTSSSGARVMIHSRCRHLPTVRTSILTWQTTASS